MTRTFCFDYEAEVIHGDDVTCPVAWVWYTCSPVIPARIRYDEHDHPAEGGEIEITKIEWQSAENFPGEHEQGEHVIRSDIDLDLSNTRSWLIEYAVETLNEERYDR